MSITSKNGGSQSNRSRLLEGPILPPLARLAIPNTASNFLMIAPFMVEVWRIAQLGAIELAGVAMVFPLFALLLMWSAGSVGGAVSGAIARAVGAGNVGQAESIARSAVVIAVMGSAFMAVMVLGAGQWLFVALGAKGRVLEVAQSYADILFSFSIIVWLFNIFAGIMRGAGDMIRPLIAIGIIAVLHFLGSGFFILGQSGMGGWGVPGAAYLLLCAYGGGLLVVFYFLTRPDMPVRLIAGKIDWQLTGRILKPGIFAASQSLTTIITSLILTGFASRFGPDVLAGFGIGARIELLMIPLIFGVGGAAIAMAGAATGAGLFWRAVRVGWVSAAIAAIVVGGIGVVLAISAANWAFIFSANETITATLISYIQMVGPAYAFLAIGLALFFTSQGMGTLLFPVLGTVVRLIIVLIGGFVIFSSEQPDSRALFMCIALAMVSYGVFVAIGLRFGPWQGKDRQ